MLTKEFLDLSTKLGKDHLLVQGAGGNTSVKNTQNMWIKASGTWLSKSNQEDIFVKVDLKEIRKEIMLDQDILLSLTKKNKNNLRPSIETSLHALMPHKIVVHTHPIKLLSLLVRKDAKTKLIEILGNEELAWVPYNRPGIDLSRSLKKVLDIKEANVILLGNHGLVVGAETCSEITKLMKRILSACEQKQEKCIKTNKKDLLQLANEMNMRLPSHEEVHYLANNNIAYKRCKDKGGILYPDQAVFLGSKMPCYDSLEDIEPEMNLPFVIIKDIGVFVSQESGKEVDIMLRCHSQLLSRISIDCELNYISEKEVGKLLNWEPEKYRLRLRE